MPRSEVIRGSLKPDAGVWIRRVERGGELWDIRNLRRTVAGDT